MKCALPLLKFACATILFGCFILACRKSSTTPEDPGKPSPGDTGVTLNADTVSNHLRFFNATKKQGAMPKGPAGSALKISFKDTLTLTDISRPINLLHEDPKLNVAGVYVQVHAGFVGASFYYDVPEVPDVATNDTVSVILIGIDPDGLNNLHGVPPAGAPLEITIVPHDPNGQPLGEVTRPIKIGSPETDIDGPCGIVTQRLDYWDWEVTYMIDPNSQGEPSPFFNNRYKLWGKVGQNIRGCCSNGQSAYTANCDSANFRFLNFQTFFNHPQETYKFFEHGAYSAMTLFLRANPDPAASNFCGSGPGVTNEELSRYLKEGDWSVASSPGPAGTSVRLNVKENTSTGGGGSDAARPAGSWIYFVDCQLLILIKPQGEGGNSYLASFYSRRGPSSPEWTPFF